MTIVEPLLKDINMESYSINEVEDEQTSGPSAIGEHDIRASMARRGSVLDNILASESDYKQRTILLFDYLNAKQEKRPVYPKNIVTTSRYTILTFLPKSLLEQFRRLANIYFLVIGTISIIGTYTNYFETAVSPDGILVPVLTVVLISMIKEGVEDIKRHTSDMKVNSKPCKAIMPDGSVKIVQRQQLQVGSLVLFQRDDEIPADVVVLQCGGIQGPIVYVETAAIGMISFVALKAYDLKSSVNDRVDGETNLKIRQPALAHIPTVIDISNTTPVPKFSMSFDRGSTRSSNLSITADRNYVYGIQTLRERLRIEAEPPNESVYRFNGCLNLAAVNIAPGSVAASYEKQEIIPLSDKNLLLRGSILRATEWCIGIVVYTGRDTKLSLNSKAPPSKLSSVDRIVNRTLLIAISVMIFVCIISMIFNITWGTNNSDANYLCLEQSDLSSVYASGGCVDSNTSSVLTIFTFATLYNNFVCISMYVSLEMVYLCQGFFLNQDLKLYDKESDTRAECHSSGLCADLGQIQFILSDKTGTLTKNVMKLRRCSLIGKVFGAPISITSGGKSERDALNTTSSEVWLSLESMHPKLSRISTISDTSSQPIYTTSESNIIKDFLRVLTLCNNVMLMPDDHGALEINDLKSLEACLQAESADEVALVIAAAQYAQVYLVARSNVAATVVGLNTESVSDFNDSETWEVLALNEFESDRKRMSILMRSSTNRYVLFCKGADSSMFSNCQQSSHTTSIIEQTEVFASSGLRTLVAAKKDLTPSEAQAWLTTYKEAKMSVFKRNEKLSVCACAIEVDMDILGCIGIEDELQDGVPDAIKQLQETGLNVWMITGDKAETAMAIGKMCNLLTDTQRIEKLVNLSGDHLRQKLQHLQTIVNQPSHSPNGSKPSNSSAITKELSTMTLESNVSPIVSIDLEANKEKPKYLDNLKAASIDAATSISSVDKPSEANTDHIAMIIDGSTLEHIWKSTELKLLFSTVMTAIPTVIACRVSPLQKASLVRMIKTSPSHPITLSIGDGANDVGMINEARVGVGISGKEGRHAANASDFAISQFRFLVPLLLEHGRFNYIRCSKLVLYSFYKNLLLVSFLFYFCIYSGFSGTIPLTSLVFTGYNFYLGLPIIAIGAFDFDIPKSFVYRYPTLAYDTGRNGELLNYWNMLRWCLWGFFIGFLIFLLCIRLIGGSIYISSTYNNGNTAYLDIAGIGLNLSSQAWGGGVYVEGLAMYTIVVVAMQVKVISMTQSRTSMFWLSIIISMLGYILFAYFYGLLTSTQWYDVLPLMFGMSEFWLGLICIPSIIGVFDAVVDEIFRHLRPSSMDKIRMYYDHETRINALKTKPKYKDSIQGVALSSTASRPTSQNLH